MNVHTQPAGVISESTCVQRDVIQNTTAPPAGIGCLAEWVALIYCSGAAGKMLINVMYAAAVKPYLHVCHGVR